MSVQWTDVTDWQTYWAPDDGIQITQLLLALIEDGFKQDGILYSSQYSFTDASIAKAMNDWSVAQAQNRMLFDSSCYRSAKDKATVDVATAGVPADQWGIGTSSVNGQILHSKIVAIVYPNNTGFTFSGSFNLSADAEEEFNIADFIWSYQRADAFATQIQQKLSWVQAHTS